MIPTTDETGACRGCGARMGMPCDLACPIDGEMVATCDCTRRGLSPVFTDPETDGRCRRCGAHVEYVPPAPPTAPMAYTMRHSDRYDPWGS